MIRAAGALVALIVILLAAPPFERLGATPQAAMLNWHIAFNALLIVLGMPLAGLVTRLAERIASAGSKNDEAGVELAEISVLDEAALDRPMQALGNAAREVVRVCELIEIMLQRIFELYENFDDEKAAALAALDDRVDKKHQAIKLYLAKLTTRDLSADEALRCQELLGACVKLEQVGDIVVRNMLVHVRKKASRKLEFTPEGWAELRDFHAAVLANARLAFNILVSRDIESARQLVREKDRMRDLEKQANSSHFKRLREGTARSVETSSIHLDTIRDLKQINSLLASIAYPVLEELGMLGGSRLKAV